MSPQQNGIAERKTIVMEMARSILETKQLSKEFWVEAVQCAVNLLNQCQLKI